MKKLFRGIMLLVTLAITPVSIAQANTKNWQPMLGGGDAFFPSAILAARNLDVQPLLDKTPLPGLVGDPMGAFGMKIHTTAENTKVHISITIDGLSETSTFEDMLPKANMEYTVLPYIRYKLEALWKIKQPYSTTAVFTVSVNDACPAPL